MTNEGRGLFCSHIRMRRLFLRQTCKASKHYITLKKKDIAITIIAIAICTNFLIRSSLIIWILVKLCFKWHTKAPKDRGGLFQSCCLLSDGNVRHHHHQFTLTASPSLAVEKHRQNHFDSSGFTAWCNRKIKAEGTCCRYSLATFEQQRPFFAQTSVASGGKRWAAGQHGVKCQSHWPSVGLPCVASVVLEVLLVEDELDVGLGVGQTLFLQRLAQLGGAAQEHPNLGPESGGRVNENASSFWFIFYGINSHFMQDETTPKFMMCLDSTSTSNSTFSVHWMVLIGCYQSFYCCKKKKRKTYRWMLMCYSRRPNRCSFSFLLHCLRKWNRQTEEPFVNVFPANIFFNFFLFSSWIIFFHE